MASSNNNLYLQASHNFPFEKTMKFEGSSYNY